MKFFTPLKKAVAFLSVVSSLLVVFVSPSHAADSIPQINFTGDWQQTVTGSLVAGGKFKVNYDSQRLPNIRDTKDGQPAWSIVAHTQFSTKTLEPVGKDGILTAEFDIPNDADKVILWFANFGERGLFEYDSDFGKNYEFPLSPADSN